MGKIAEIFVAADRADAARVRRQNAFRELAPSFIAEIRIGVRREIDELNAQLIAAGRPNVVQCSNTAGGIDVMYRSPVPVYSLRVSSDTETLRVLANDECRATFRLIVDNEAMKLAGVVDSQSIPDDELIFKALTPFALAVQQAHRFE